MKDNKDTMAVDISDIQPSQGDYICPYCGVFMLPLSLHDCESIRTDASTGVEVQCQSCGYKLNPITDQTKHASKISPKITEEMIADEYEDSIFETIEEDSGRIEDKEETYDFAEDDKRDEKSLRRKGYRIFSSN
jgi:hypothetical protein